MATSGYGDFPSVVSMVPPMLEERFARMEVELSAQKQELSAQKEKLDIHADLLLEFVGRDIVILAEEILKWAVQRRGEDIGDGSQLYGRVVRAFLACQAYGEYGLNPTLGDLEAFKRMSKAVIKLRNDTAYFEDLASLEDMVKTCKIAIKEWPSLGVKFPHQVKIIKDYHMFKQLLPASFQ